MRLAPSTGLNEVEDDAFSELASLRASEADGGSIAEFGTARVSWISGSAFAGLADTRVGGSATSPLARLVDVRTWALVRLVADVVVLYLASAAALFADAAIRSVTTDQVLAATFPLIVLANLYLRPGRHDQLAGSHIDAFARVGGAVALAAMMTIALNSILGNPQPVGLAVRLWLFGSAYLGVARLGLLSLRQHLSSRRGLATPTLVVGAGVVGEHVVKRLLGNPGYGLKPVGFVDTDPLPRQSGDASSAIPVLGGLDDLAATVQQTGARQVILAFTSEPDHVLVEKVRECQRLGVEVAMVPRLFESVSVRSSLDHVGGLPLLSLRPTNPRGWQFGVKHAIDASLAFVTLVGLAPLLAIIALLVRLSSSGPILFRQQRMGRDGREFTMLKFRTMRGDPAAEGEADAGWAAQIRGQAGQAPPVGQGPPAPVDRTTRIGRLLRTTSLDELPQLFSVLRGDMSLVGPRPERVHYARDFTAEVDHYHDRHRVKSGMTGWAQVNGLRGQTSIADRVEWDNYYIQNWSLLLDIKIVALTISEILRFRG